jgi:hypothetical protein
MKNVIVVGLKGTEVGRGGTYICRGVNDGHCRKSVPKKLLCNRSARTGFLQQGSIMQVHEALLYSPLSGASQMLAHLGVGSSS